MFNKIILKHLALLVFTGLIAFLVGDHSVFRIVPLWAIKLSSNSEHKFSTSFDGHFSSNSSTLTLTVINGYNSSSYFTYELPSDDALEYFLSEISEKKPSLHKLKLNKHTVFSDCVLLGLNTDYADGTLVSCIHLHCLRASAC